jgi:hypothetical protein
MGINVFPVPSSGGPSTIKQTLYATTANTVIYGATVALTAGVYTVTCISSTVTTMSFYAGDTLLTSATTSSGTASVNLATAATRVTYFTNTGSNIQVDIQITGQAVTFAATGSLTTLTNTQTWASNAAGPAYVVVVGGGGGGRNGAPYSGTAGGGGGGALSGSQVSLAVQNYTITVAGSVAQNTAGGTTNAFGMTANGGATGNFGASGGGGSASGGTINTTGSAGGYNVNAVATPSPYLFVVNGSNGGGGAAGNTGNVGAGSGIGTGGNGGTPGFPTNGGNGSGFGAGGGGGSNNNSAGSNGGSGSAGVVYILRV